MDSTPQGWFGITRRGFLLGTMTGLVGGAALAWLGKGYVPPLLPSLNPVTPEESTTIAQRPAGPKMPGRFPGRVVEVHDPTSVDDLNRIQAGAVSQMVDRGMAELTGYEAGDLNAWKALFQKGDVVGIKVNPVGRAPKKGEGGRVHRAVGSISSPELVIKIVKSLEAVGIPRKDIVIFERYANEFRDAGYLNLVERDLPGVRWMASAASYSNYQLDIRGRDADCEVLSPEVERHVVGYDPDVFTTMGFCDPSHSVRDERRYNSHLSMVVTRLVDKVITLPVLKDHRSAGVTLSLKNMSHGMNNNVARSHLAGIAHGIGPEGKVLGPNQCNTFIPQAVAQARMREKMTLHILDGLIGVYEGGPGCWNKTWGTWRRKSLFFATDPVAMDHVCWTIIDEKRAEMLWPPVARMGYLFNEPHTQVVSSVTPYASHNALSAVALMTATKNRMEGRYSEAFNVRQPDHVILAGKLGLGEFDPERITYLRVG